MSDSGFLQRWARRKAQAQRSALAPSALPGAPVAAPAAASPAAAVATEAARLAPDARAGGAPCERASPEDPAPPGTASAPSGSAPPVEPLPAVESLTMADDFSPFMADGVDATTRNGALRKLFSDPHFNVMDGLDTYVDDYSKPDPIAPAMLRTLRQAHALGLFDDEPQGECAAATDRPEIDAGADVADRPEPGPGAGIAPADPAASREPPAGDATAAVADDVMFATAPGPHYDPARRTGSP